MVAILLSSTTSDPPRKHWCRACRQGADQETKGVTSCIHRMAPVSNTNANKRAKQRPDGGGRNYDSRGFLRGPWGAYPCPFVLVPNQVTGPASRRRSLRQIDFVECIGECDGYVYYWTFTIRGRVSGSTKNADRHLYPLAWGAKQTCFQSKRQSIFSKKRTRLVGGSRL